MQEIQKKAEIRGQEMSDSIFQESAHEDYLRDQPASLNALRSSFCAKNETFSTGTRNFSFLID